MHATVRLAERIHLEESGQVSDTTDASDAFRVAGREVDDLYDEARQIRREYFIGGGLMGGFLGLVIGLKLIGLLLRPKTTEYQADPGWCLACGRCFAYCPMEHKRRADLKKSG